MMFLIPDQESIYFMGSETLPVTYFPTISTCYILSDEASIPFYSTFNGYTYNRHKEAFATDKVYMFRIPDQEYILFMGSETLPLPVTYFPTVYYTLLLYE